MTAANLQFFAADLQCITWVKKRRAHACHFPGTVLAWGRQNRGREHSL